MVLNSDRNDGGKDWKPLVRDGQFGDERESGENICQEVNDRGGSFVTVRRICQGLNQLQHESCNCCPSANGRRNQNPASADMG
ncbi:hypothetical protein V6N12_054457 [Hibiscus sabdariffa]|uniref:Uncharacterized protein n=1 Tax=Hibiscus sabdariffa TaxID=183260 RepID=A0ABR2D0H8_9ROSI